jgi:hypothetical protein
LTATDEPRHDRRRNWRRRIDGRAGSRQPTKGTTMAVMVSFTLKTDRATYQRIHPQMLPVARKAGMLFHSSREVHGQIAIVDFWPSEDAWRAFSTGPLVEGMKSAGIAPPDDLVVTPVINADGK